jgi:hypothetical protein
MGCADEYHECGGDLWVWWVRGAVNVRLRFDMWLIKAHVDEKFYIDVRRI